MCLTTFIVHCFICVSASEVAQTQAIDASKKVDNFKNKEVLRQNEIPELALVKSLIEKKHESLTGFVEAWENVDHRNLQLSAGESLVSLLFVFFFFSFIGNHILGMDD